MDRGRGYTHKVRRNKIKRRRQMIWRLWSPHYIYSSLKKSKFHDAVYGRRGGLLAKDDYGYIRGQLPVKTNSRKGHASYRHKGAYGRADNYRRSDQIQVDDMRQQINEFMREEYIDG